MIHIITASPCYDFYVEVPNDFQVKEVIYYNYSEIHIGGKGLNVSRKLEEIGVKNKNYLFLGNKNSADYLRIYKESFNSQIEYIEYDGYVRTNFKFVKRDGNNIKVLKEMNKKPSALDDNSYQNLVKLLCESYVDDEINFILLCGSVNPSNFYERFLHDERLKKFKFIIDTSKEALAFCLQSDNIYLLKPNLDELKEINTDYKPFFDLIHENSEKNSEILEKFFISNSLFTNKNFYITNNKYDSYFYDATSKKCSVIKTENTGETKRSTVGAGDKSLAYTLYFLKQGKGLKDAVTEALSAISYELVTGNSYLKRISMKERVLGYSNKGKVKPNNEDCFVIDNETYLGDNEVSKNKANLCVVLDGIGGENFGELASKFGAEFVAENFKEFLVHDKNSISELLNKCSNYIIQNLSNLKESRFSGTTIAGFMFNKDDKDVVTIFNVGDSRVYCVGQKYIEQISYDDSMVNYLIKMGLISKADKDKVPVNKNIIFNALGNSHFKVQESHVFSFNMKMSQKKIDYIFCCTDGVTDNISDKELFRLFTHRHPKSLSEIKDRIVNAVEKEGSSDNYSFVILDLSK